MRRAAFRRLLQREGRPTEKETLTSRLIDRPIRPLFPEGFTNRRASRGLGPVGELGDRSGHRRADWRVRGAGDFRYAFLGPIGAARVGYKDGKYLLNPTATQLNESKLDLVVAGTAEGVLMVESEAKGLDEQTMLGAVMFGHEQMQIAIKAINDLVAEAGKPKWSWVAPEPNVELKSAVSALAEKDLTAAYAITEKQQRYARIGRDQERRAPVARLGASGMGPSSRRIRLAVSSSISSTAWCAERILQGHPRIDGRDPRLYARSTSVRACSPAPTAPRCSRARDTGAGGDHARHGPRRSNHRRPHRRAQKSRSCFTTTSRRSASARPA